MHRVWIIGLTVAILAVASSDRATAQARQLDSGQISGGGPSILGGIQIADGPKSTVTCDVPGVGWCQVSGVAPISAGTSCYCVDGGKNVAGSTR
jgi:hypothetical protein